MNCTKPSPSSLGRQILALTGWVLLCFAAAALGGWFMPGEWYASLKKPAWNPPGWIFGPVWTALYILMAVARAGVAARRIRGAAPPVGPVPRANWRSTPPGRRCSSGCTGRARPLPKSFCSGSPSPQPSLRFAP